MRSVGVTVVKTRSTIPRIPLADPEERERDRDEAEAERVERGEHDAGPQPKEEPEYRLPPRQKGSAPGVTGVVDEASPATLLAEAIEDWELGTGAGSNPSSLRNRRDRLAVFTRYLELSIHGPHQNQALAADVAALSYDNVQAFIWWLQKDLVRRPRDETGQRPHHPGHYERSTVESIIKALISLERWLVPGPGEKRRPYKAQLELRGLKYQRPAADEMGRLPYIDRERDAIIEAASRGATGPAWRMTAVLLLGTGMRAAEVCGVNLGDVVFDGGYIQLQAQVTKGEVHSRKVTLWEDVEDEIRRYVSQFRKGPRRYDTPLVTTREGRRYTTDGLKRIFRTLQGRLPDVPDLKAHRCRNTAAVDMLRIGMSTIQLANELGHRDHRQSHKYAKHIPPGKSIGTTPLNVRHERADRGRVEYFERRSATESEREADLREREELVEKFKPLQRGRKKSR